MPGFPYPDIIDKKERWIGSKSYQMWSDKSSPSGDQDPAAILVIQKFDHRIIALIGRSENKIGHIVVLLTFFQIQIEN